MSQAEFDAEVKKLSLLGLNELEIAKRLHRSRWPIGDSLKRIKLTPQEKEEKKWVKLNADDFWQLPEVAPWLESMKAQRIGHDGIVGAGKVVRLVCDQLQIYPTMLDLPYCSKWLANQGHLTDAQLRAWKLGLRKWEQFEFKASDSELRQAGLGAEHYEVGKYAYIRMTDDEWLKCNTFFEAYQLKDPLFGLNFCHDTMSRSGEVASMQPQYFSDRGNLITVTIPAKKTGTFEPGWVSRRTFRLGKETLPFTNGRFDKATEDLRGAYKYAGLTDAYFNAHPWHALRHCGAQYWLDRTNWNRPAVCKIGHWHAELTLKMYYGEIPDEVVIRAFQAGTIDELPIVQGVN